MYLIQRYDHCFHNLLNNKIKIFFAVKNHFLRVYVSIKNQPYDMTAKCNICKESHNKSCEFLHAIHDLDWGSFINQVDS